MTAVVFAVQPEPEFDHDAEWQPRPRTAWKCTVCGRFVPAATVRARGYVTGEVVRTGACSRCGREEVW